MQTCKARKYVSNLVKVWGEEMKKINFDASLVLQESGYWRFNPANERAREFVPVNARHNHVSFLEVIRSFDDGDILQVTIEKIGRVKT